MRNEKNYDNKHRGAFAKDDKYDEKQSGLTKREYFAGQVIMGKTGNPKEIAEHAIMVANELLNQLNP